MSRIQFALPCGALLALASLVHVQAQPATPAPSSAQGAAGAASAPRGPGAGPGGRGMMHGRWGREYTPGWSMMTPQERDEHHRRMREAGTPEQCRAAVDEHRKLMQERANERGMAPLRAPRRDACGGWGRG